MRALFLLLGVFLGFEPAHASLDAWEFEQVRDRILAIYESELLALPKPLAIQDLWDSPTENAFVTDSDESSVMTMHLHGGLARYALTTLDTMAAVICHELGHVLGGAPRILGGGFRNGHLPARLSIEAQADAFAANKCLKRYFRLYPSTVVYSPDPLVEEKCSQFHLTPEDQTICKSIAYAGRDMLQAYLRIFGSNDILRHRHQRFQSTDLIVRQGYPSYSCRNRTYLAGALCTAPAEVNFDPGDTSIGACTVEYDFWQQRPRCWFNPADTADRYVPYH